MSNIPPFNKESEEAVLGALLLERDAYLKVADILQPSDFYSDKNKQIYTAVAEMFAKNLSIDVITVANYLTKKGLKPDYFYITQLTSRVASAAHITGHAAMIVEQSIRRLLITKGAEISKAASDKSADLEDVFSNVLSISDTILEKTQNKAVVLSLKESLVQTIDTIQENERNRAEGIKKTCLSHINGLQNKIPEWAKGNLIVIAGRPSMGKSAYAIDEALMLALHNTNVLFFSLEMSAYQLTMRVLQRETDMDRYDFEKQLTPLDWSKMDTAVAKLQDAGLFIDETPGVSFAHIKAKAKIYKKMHNVGAIFIDYLQLMQANKRLPREEQVAEVSRNLKLLAKELEIPIFILAQLNRNAEARKESGFKPRLCDLRESGAIEQDADVVLFPYRPEYYYPNDPELKNQGLIIIAKNRHGRIGEVPVLINNSVTKFTDPGRSGLSRNPKF